MDTAEMIWWRWDQSPSLVSIVPPPLMSVMAVMGERGAGWSKMASLQNPIQTSSGPLLCSHQEQPPGKNRSFSLSAQFSQWANKDNLYEIEFPLLIFQNWGKLYIFIFDSLVSCCCCCWVQLCIRCLSSAWQTDDMTYHIQFCGTFYSAVYLLYVCLRDRHLHRCRQ